MAADDSTNHHYLVKGQIGLIWFLWFLQQYLVLIILLNFLIALISDTYNKVKEDEMETMYNQRCELTWECTLLTE